MSTRRPFGKVKKTCNANLLSLSDQIYNSRTDEGGQGELIMGMRTGRRSCMCVAVVMWFLSRMFFLNRWTDCSRLLVV